MVERIWKMVLRNSKVISKLVIVWDKTTLKKKKKECDNKQ